MAGGRLRVLAVREALPAAVSTFIAGDYGRAHALHLLTTQDACIRGLADHWPFPRWIKILHDDQSIIVMAWLNQAYVDWYKVDPYAYIGHCDRSQYDDETAAIYAANDRAAIEKPYQILTVSEPTPRGEQPAHKVRKFAFRIDTPDVKGWGIYGECTAD